MLMVEPVELSVKYKASIKDIQTCLARHFNVFSFINLEEEKFGTLAKSIELFAYENRASFDDFLMFVSRNKLIISFCDDNYPDSETRLKFLVFLKELLASNSTIYSACDWCEIHEEKEYDEWEDLIPIENNFILEVDIFSDELLLRLLIVTQAIYDIDDSYFFLYSICKNIIKLSAKAHYKNDSKDAILLMRYSTKLGIDPFIRYFSFIQNQSEYIQESEQILKLALPMLIVSLKEMLIDHFNHCFAKRLEVDDLQDTNYFNKQYLYLFLEWLEGTDNAIFNNPQNLSLILSLLGQPFDRFLVSHEEFYNQFCLPILKSGYGADFQSHIKKSNDKFKALIDNLFLLGDKLEHQVNRHKSERLVGIYPPYHSNTPEPSYVHQDSQSETGITETYYEPGYLDEYEEDYSNLLTDDTGPDLTDSYNPNDEDNERYYEDDPTL
jgi:hypothetical protein